MKSVVDGSSVVISGIVTISAKATGIRPGTAKISDADYGDVDTVWWPPLIPPATGVEITVHGTVKYYKGSPQVTVDGSPKAIPATPDGRVIAFLRDCVESEAQSDLEFSESRRSHLAITAQSIDIDALHGITIPDSGRASKWIAERAHGLTETTLLGIALVRNDAGSATTWTPLLTAEVLLDSSTKPATASVMSSSFDLNPSALKSLDLDSSEVESLLSALRDDPEYEEASTSSKRLAIALHHLVNVKALTADQAATISLSNLRSRPSESDRIWNSAVLIATSGSAAYTAKLLQELTEIIGQNPSFTTGPLGVLFGHASVTPVPFPSSNPILVPTSMRQDQAITSAMANHLTVITGPPGTGKSQVLVNLVNASLIRGETILFASKNNQAVDVVFERLASVSPESRVLRAGPARRRSELVSAIELAIQRQETPPGKPNARATQAAMDAVVNEAYAPKRRDVELESKIQSLEREIEQRLAIVPQGIRSEVSVDEVIAGFEMVCRDLTAVRAPLPWFRRWKRRPVLDQRLENVDASIERLDELFLIPEVDPKGVWSQSITNTRDLKPSRRDIARDVRNLQRIADALSQIKKLTKKLDAARQARIEIDMSKIEDTIQKLNPDRVAAGRVLAASEAAARLAANPKSIEAARVLLGHISTAANGGTGAMAARKVLPKALPALPGWGVTNLSVGTTFPLEGQLFDLVVIDEASQCDLASAIPLLYRAKRAVIIGDPRQLTHITSLGSAREKVIADKYELTDDQAVDFSYRAQSLYLAAARRFGAPIFLNLHFRSHPAIIEFSNQFVYGQQLEICTTPTADAGHAIRWINVDGDCAQRPGRGSWSNHQEAERVVEVAKEIAATGTTDIGIVTPYRAQTELIIELLRRDASTIADGLPVATAHRFQGDERDHIIFSPVIGPSMSPQSFRFAGDPNLLNVALTRARRTLTIVGNLDACQNAGNLLHDLANYVTQIEQSVFDSPLELRLFDLLEQRGIEATPGRLVAGHRCDLAVETTNSRIDIECDGHPFHFDEASDLLRDQAIEALGWTVVRFSGRELSRYPKSCADKIEQLLSPN